MASTTVDLPDPLQLSAVQPAEADELLSQMAGEEIDRLMADAAADRPFVATPTPPAMEIATAIEVPAAVEPTNLSTSAMPDEPPPTTPAGDETITRQLDHVFDQQISASPSPAEAAPASEIVPTQEITAAKEQAAAKDVNDLLGRLDAGERAPQPPTGAAASDAIHPASLVASTETQTKVALLGAPARGPSILSKLLDWVSVPLDPFPPATRDFIGKAAIITTVNALAVLLYVLLFRS